jgi:hypothetical protein
VVYYDPNYVAVTFPPLRVRNTHSGIPEVAVTEHWQEFRFMIDGKTFDPNRVDHDAGSRGLRRLTALRRGDRRVG